MKGFQQQGIQFGIFGDIDLQPHKDWEDKVCRKAALEAVLERQQVRNLFSFFWILGSWIEAEGSGMIESRRAEPTHWLQVIWVPVFFLFNPFWIGVIMIGYAPIVNLPCILVQRYNRPRLKRILEGTKLSPLKQGDSIISESPV